jgi:hypothetical protein
MKYIFLSLSVETRILLPFKMSLNPVYCAKNWEECEYGGKTNRRIT